jgi:[glutamine synthetase] adenylyltransferase / [glutamine synthetase]-adenylyl-L-tyrosine phosphorylase
MRDLGALIKYRNIDQQLQLVDFQTFFCILIAMATQKIPDVFTDPERAEKLLRDLVEPLLGLFDERGGKHTPDAVAQYFLTALRSSPDPDKALVNLHRIEDVSFGSTLLTDLLRYPVLLDLLVTVASRSQFLSDILVRNPSWFRWLTASDVLGKTKSAEDLKAELGQQINAFEKSLAKFNAVRRFQRRELLRIGVRDLLGEAPLETTVRELSALADTVASVVYSIVVANVAGKLGWRPATPSAVIGLGKLGGNELNYSSDIDIMFVMGEDETGRDREGRERHAIDFYHTVADTWIRVMTEQSSEGMLYRVDARLRPDGDAGPLVRSVQGCLTYYETRGELWERQMLIKARPIGGDLDFGNRFIERLQPFVYPGTLFQSPKQTIARMKSRIEKTSGDERNIKLRRGGIRDIEFIVQVLQLINGGKHREIRTGTTLDALERLHAHALLTASELDDLRSAYRFLRLVEHRLQLDENKQTHSIPGNETERRRLALSLGYASAEEFDRALAENIERVSSLFGNVFITDDATYHAEEMFAASPDDEPVGLHRYGFRDEARAQRLLSQIAIGVSSSGVGEHDAQTRELFRRIAPELLQRLRETVDPDRGLKNILLLVQSYPHPYAFFQALTNPNTMLAFVTASGFSNKLVLDLSRHPDDCELLMANADPVMETAEIAGLEIVRDRPRFLKLCTHIRFLANRIPLHEVHRELSRLARSSVSRAFDAVCDRLGFREPPFFVLSLGKLSGDELGPDADLDLIFFWKQTDTFTYADAEKLARALIQHCRNDDDRRYELDLRLRPEGQSGPLVVDIDTYPDYLQKRASFWERQSLLKAGAVCGSDTVRGRVETIVRDYVYRLPLPGGWQDELETMRYRTESRSRMNRTDFIDVKFGPGGVMDIEFLVQAYQLHAARTRMELRGSNTRSVIDQMVKHGLLDGEVGESLTHAYDRYRLLEYFNRMYREDPANLVPEPPEERTALREFLGVGRDPLVIYRDLSESVRNVFKKHMKTLKSP